MADYKIVSADSHAEEPGSIYEKLPEQFRHRKPHVEVIDGRKYQVLDGQQPILLDTPNPLTEKDLRKEFRGGEDVGIGVNREWGTDVEIRLKDQVEDGVSAEVIYPNGIFEAFSSPEPGYQMAVCSLYNDYYWDVFSAHSDVCIPSATIPTIDVDAAVTEARRIGAMGYRSVSVPVNVASTPYNLPVYEPFWSTLADIGLPLSFHVFTKTEPVSDDEPRKYRTIEETNGQDLTGMVLGMAEAMAPLTALTAAGVFDRNPSLRIVLVECGIGWLAWALYAMDDVYRARHMWQYPNLDRLPSEYFKTNGFITFGDDPIGLNNIEFTGVDGLMWGSDYPHDEGTFPHSQEVIERTFANISAEDKIKIVGENAARLYGINLN